MSKAKGEGHGSRLLGAGKAGDMRESPIWDRYTIDDIHAKAEL
jgi:hypothetical protein